MILGAGGTAQAAVAALADGGAGAGDLEIVVLVREPASEHRAPVDRRAAGSGPTVVGGMPGVPLPPADVVISTVPGRAADAYASTRWSPETVVLDVIYDPWPTELIASAMPRDAAWPAASTCCCIRRSSRSR